MGECRATALPSQAPSLTCWDFALPFLLSIIYHPLPHKKMHLGVHSTPSSSRISCGSTTEAPDPLRNTTEHLETPHLLETQAWRTDLDQGAAMQTPRLCFRGDEAPRPEQGAGGRGREGPSEER